MNGGDMGRFWCLRKGLDETGWIWGGKVRILGRFYWGLGMSKAGFLWVGRELRWTLTREVNSDNGLYHLKEFYKGGKIWLQNGSEDNVVKWITAGQHRDNII
jgi:hypothetical protein